MSKLGSFLKLLGEKIVANKVKSIIIGSIAAVVVGGTVTGIAIANIHEHTPLSAVIENRINATCEHEGCYDEVVYCGGCEEEIERKKVMIDALGHTESEWIIDKNATCTEEGSKHRVCVVCNNTITTGTVGKLGHSEGDWIVDVEATCTEEGSKHQACSLCNDTLKTESISKLSHLDGDWITDVEATCTEEGSRHQVCAVCNDTIKTESISKIPHTDGEWITDIDATCTEEGSKHQICSVCSAIIKTEEIEATGLHNYVENIIYPATCGDSGVKKFTCTVCDYSYTETIKPTNQHSYADPVIIEATCAENGSKTYTCSICSYSITTVISATGEHDYVSKVTKEATCVSNGIITYTCSTCGGSYTRTYSVESRVHGKLINGYCSICNKYIGSDDTYSTYYYAELKYYILDNGTFDSTNKRYTWMINAETSNQGSRYVYYAYYDSKLNSVVLSVVWDDTHVMAIALDTRLTGRYAWTYTNTDGFRLAGTLSARSYTSSSTVLYPTESNAYDGNLNLTLRQMSAIMLNLILMNVETEVKPILDVSCESIGFSNFL